MRSLLIVIVLLSVTAVVSANVVTGTWYNGLNCPSAQSYKFTVSDNKNDGSQCTSYSQTSINSSITTGYARVYSCQQSGGVTNVTLAAWKTLSECQNPTFPDVYVYMAYAPFDSTSNSTCFNSAQQFPSSVSNINCNANPQDISEFIAFIENFLALVLVLFFLLICCSIAGGIYVCCLPAFLACLWCANNNKKAAGGTVFLDNTNAYAQMKDPLNQYNQTPFSPHTNV